MSKRQLFHLTDVHFECPTYLDADGRLFTRPANNIPLIKWPNGAWCSPANTFMRELFEKGLSRRNRGGTLAVAASNISHLLRFCWQRRLDLHHLTDNDFYNFIGSLLAQTSDPGSKQKARSSTTVITIGRTCLQLLDSVARHRNDVQLIGTEGRIRAELRKFELRPAGRGSKRPARTVEYWHHAALPTAEVKKRRLPISSKNIELLRMAVGTTSASSHHRMRRHVVLKLLEITGARRGEIAEIRVEWVTDAAQMEWPMLRVPTFKRREQSTTRLIPVSKSDLAFIVRYMEFYRASIMRRYFKRKLDHGYLLVSETSGEALRPNSLTQDIKQLALSAGIVERACPHMFRHRFLTKLFVALIEQHEAETPDQFRKLLLDSEQLKRKVAEWSGHSNLDSLSHYIDLAFDEVGDFKRVYDLVGVGIALDSFLGTLEAEAQSLSRGEEPSVVVERLLLQIADLSLDLKAQKEAAAVR